MRRKHRVTCPLLDSLQQQQQSSSAWKRIFSYYYLIDKFQVAHKLHCLEDVVVDKDANSLSTVTALDIDLAEGRYILSGEKDGSIYLYDLLPYSLEKRTKLPCLSHHHPSSSGIENTSVSSLFWYTLDNGMFFSLQHLGRKSSVSIWDTNLFAIEQVIEYSDVPIYSMAVCPASCMQPLLALSSDKKIFLLDVRVGKKAVGELRGEGWNCGVSCVEWCPNVDYCLAAGTFEGDLCLVDCRKPQPPNNRLVTMNPFLYSSIWNCNPPVLVAPMSRCVDKNVQGKLSWSPSSRFVTNYTCKKNNILVKRKYDDIDDAWNQIERDYISSPMSQEYSPVAMHRAHSSSIQSIHFLWNCRYASSLDTQGNVHVWDTLTGYLVHSLYCSCLPNQRKMKYSGKSISVAWDNKTLLYALDSKLYSFDAISGKHCTTIETLGTEVTAFTCHPWEPLSICGSIRGELIFFGIEDNIFLCKPSALPRGVANCSYEK